MWLPSAVTNPLEGLFTGSEPRYFAWTAILLPSYGCWVTSLAWMQSFK